MRIRSSPISLGAAVVLAAVVSVPALGQVRAPIFENELTVTATGTDEQLDDVPLPVTVIGRAEIEDAQEESVADLLRRVPGLSVLRTGDEGSPASVFVRGTESDHTLLMFDGVRLNSPYFAGYDWSLLPSAGLERIEVARGPFSALWGADAIGGAVNVVPSRARDGLSGSLLGEGGNDGWQRFEGTVSWAGGGFDLYASGFDREGEGQLQNSDFDTRQVLVNAGWSWSEGSRMALLVQDLDNEIGVPFSDPLNPTPNRRQRSEQRLVALPLKVHVTDAWGLEVVASQVERALFFRDPDDRYGFTSSDTLSDTVQGRLASRHRLGDHGLTWGGEWRRDEVTDTSSHGVNLDGETTEVLSLFVQDVWQASDQLRVIAGFRWDEADLWGSEVSPRLLVGWRVGADFELRGGYGRAFRQPSVGELYFPLSGNPELEPETSESVEVGVSWFAGTSRVQANLFATRIDNLIDFDYATYTFANATEAEMRGVELAWETPLSARFACRLQGTWLDTEDAGGNPLLRRPEWSGSWSLQGGLWKRLRGDLTLIYVGSRADIDAVTLGRIEMGGHVTANLSAAYELLRGLQILLRVQNVTNEGYQEVNGYPAPDRRITAGLRLSLS
jgi:vitamin B12 transporter